MLAARRATPPNAVESMRSGPVRNGTPLRTFSMATPAAKFGSISPLASRLTSRLTPPGPAHPPPTADAPGLGTRRLSAGLGGGGGPMSRLGQEAARGSPATPPHAALGHVPDFAAAHTSQQQQQSQPDAARHTSSSIKRMPYTQQLQIPDLTWEADESEGATGSWKEEQDSTLEGLTSGTPRLRFSRDQRLLQVYKLLASNAPTTLKTSSAPEVSDPEMVAHQQAQLLSLASRTMALPLGRGALTLGTFHPLPTEPLAMPPLVLAGRVPEQHNAVVNLDMTTMQPPRCGGAASELTAWPEFHNGVAAGLRLSRGCAQLTRTWIVYNKPPALSYQHAGLLMGLGLTGHLSCLSATDLYRYLSQEHEATTIGVLLGMAAAKRSSADASISKMLFLHVPTRHPPTYPELELSPHVQAAAILGAGLLYMGSCQRLTAEILLEEIRRRPGTGGGEEGVSSSGGAVAQDREGYALAAGLALGLVTLGRGQDAPGLADIRMADSLRVLMTGGGDPSSGKHEAFHARGERLVGPATIFGPGIVGFDPTLGSLGTSMLPMPPNHQASLGRPTEDTLSGSGISQVVLEGNLVNLDVTSPAATLALALMFLKTNDVGVAASFVIPDTHFALDYVRPNFILLRVLARALVMWDKLLPTEAWVQQQLPRLLRGPLSKLMAATKAGAEDIDRESLAQGHMMAITGACLAMGIRYAGSANAAAYGVLKHYLLYLLAAKKRAPDASQGAEATWGRLDKQALEACLDLVTLSLSVVMAGTGHLPTLKLLRGMRLRLQPPPSPAAMGGLSHGNHLAIGMALGFLFMGGGTQTFGTSNEAVAALVIALFPHFPISPMDNRCHLQAFRHLYALAAEPRCLEAVDVDTRQPVSVPVRITLDPTAVGQEDSGPGLPVTPMYFSPGEEEIAHSQAPGGSWDAHDGDDEAAASQLAFTRMTPCLLPELAQVREIQVCGPRYWTFRVAKRLAGASEITNCPLTSLYTSRNLFVQRKTGTLSYGDDPTGVRSILSRAFTPQVPLGRQGDGNSFDLVHLCATFSASPLVTSFAQRFCTPQGNEDSFVESLGGATGPQEQALQAFSRQILAECMGQEKAAMLQPYLFFRTLVQLYVDSIKPGGGGSVDGKGSGGLTVQLWSLKLALAYYDSCVRGGTALPGSPASPEG
ncbi:hypothetical protein WJX84_010452 [Apatococcus fuscideae]|uniref:Anaphase-promoting complex subunit 1 C-terminal domain-containing protein n=1 Tax=Apatococcus fuscideae TaxID=2026836 RepID=A0AAW1RNV6_9CHLO